MDENDDRQHFSLKRIMENEKKKKKRKKKKKEDENKEDTFSVNVDDPRFSALYSSHLFAIDPSDPQFKYVVTWTRLDCQTIYVLNCIPFWKALTSGNSHLSPSRYLA